MAYLVRINPARNERRYYLIAVQSTILGQWCVVCVHGRIDRSARPLPPIPCADEPAALALAERIEQRKRRRGYVPAGMNPERQSDDNQTV